MRATHCVLLFRRDSCAFDTHTNSRFSLSPRARSQGSTPFLTIGIHQRPTTGRDLGFSLDFARVVFDWCLCEGTIERVPKSPTDRDERVGTIDTQIRSGIHQLEGKFVTLAKPFVVLNRERDPANDGGARFVVPPSPAPAHSFFLLGGGHLRASHGGPDTRSSWGFFFVFFSFSLLPFKQRTSQTRRLPAS